MHINRSRDHLVRIENKILYMYYTLKPGVYEVTRGVYLLWISIILILFASNIITKLLLNVYPPMMYCIT